MATTQRTPRTEKFYRWNRDTPLTDTELNRRFIDLHLRLLFAETEKLSDEALRQEIGDKVLAASEAVIAGLRDKLLALTQLEWLTASSQSAITLVEGASRNLVIPADQRELFSPGPYVIIGREGAPDTYAVARAQTFDRETGDFAVTLTAVVTPPGDDGPWSDWEIGSLAGSTQAQMVLLQQGYSARDAAEASAEAAAASQLAAGTSASVAAAEADFADDQAEAAAGSALAAGASAAVAEAEADYAAAQAAIAEAAAASINAAAINAAILLGEQRRIFFR